MPNDQEIGVSWRELWTEGHLTRFSILCLGVWLHAADSLLVATLLPSAVEEIGGAPLINWTIALYQLGTIVAGAATGLFVARFGLRQAMAVAACVYAAGCAMSALTPSMEMMLFGRLLQGLGGGCLVALAYVAVSQLFPARLTPRLIAIVSAVWGSSAFFGPLIGGIFASLGLWRFGFWAFAAQAVLLAGAALLLIENRPESRTGPSPRVPWRRLAIFSAAVLAIATAGIEVSITTSPWLGGLGLLLLWLFFRLDGRALDDPLFPRGSLDLSRPVGAGIVMVLATATATISFTVYGPILMKALYGAGPLTAGYMIAIESVSWSVAAIVFSGATAAAERRVIRAGSVMMTIAVAGLAIVFPNGSLLSLVPFLILSGAGFGMAFAFILRRVVTHARPEERERASTSIPTIHWMGYAIGAAASGIVANLAGFAEGITPSGAQTVGFWIFAAFVPLALFGNFAAWRLTKVS
jgi:MFS family permease